jgi:hypothetical protein
MGQSVMGSDVSEVSNVQGGVDWLLQTGIGDYLSQMYLVRRFEQWVRQRSGLDVFNIRTNFVQNFAAQILNPSINSGVLGNFFDNTMVYIGSYIRPNIFLHGMASLRYNRNNWFQTDSTALNFEDYNLDVELGFELESPVGNIGWTITPKHYEDMFVSDMTFSIGWSTTF